MDTLYTPTSYNTDSYGKCLKRACLSFKTKVHRKGDKAAWIQRATEQIESQKELLLAQIEVMMTELRKLDDDNDDNDNVNDNDGDDNNNNKLSYIME